MKRTLSLVVVATSCVVLLAGRAHAGEHKDPYPTMWEHFVNLITFKSVRVAAGAKADFLAEVVGPQYWSTKPATLHAWPIFGGPRVKVKAQLVEMDYSVSGADRFARNGAQHFQVTATYYDKKYTRDYTFDGGASVGVAKVKPRSFGAEVKRPWKHHP